MKFHFLAYLKISALVLLPELFINSLTKIQKMKSTSATVLILQAGYKAIAGILDL